MDWRTFALYAAAFLISLSFHESAHAWTASRLGDMTGARLGRISLNPMRHIDLFGTILLPLMLWFGSHGTVMFGYAKPVPYNPYALKNPPLGSAAIAAAGPLSNLLLAVVAAYSFGLLTHGSGFAGGSVGAQFFRILMFVNVGLASFNLIPCPPLDGGTVLSGLLPAGPRQAFAQIERYGFLILLALMYTGMLDRILGPVQDFLLTYLLKFAGGFRG